MTADVENYRNYIFTNEKKIRYSKSHILRAYLTKASEAIEGIVPLSASDAFCLRYKMEEEIDNGSKITFLLQVVLYPAW